MYLNVIQLAHSHTPVTAPSFSYKCLVSHMSLPVKLTKEQCSTQPVLENPLC